MKLSQRIICEGCSWWFMGTLNIEHWFLPTHAPSTRRYSSLQSVQIPDARHTSQPSEQSEEEEEDNQELLNRASDLSRVTWVRVWAYLSMLLLGRQRTGYHIHRTRYCHMIGNVRNHILQNINIALRFAMHFVKQIKTFSSTRLILMKVKFTAAYNHTFWKVKGQFLNGKLLRYINFFLDFNTCFIIRYCIWYTTNICHGCQHYSDGLVMRWRIDHTYLHILLQVENIPCHIPYTFLPPRPHMPHS